jgi:hypothetical protein
MGEEVYSEKSFTFNSAKPSDYCGRQHSVFALQSLIESLVVKFFGGVTGL